MYFPTDSNLQFPGTMSVKTHSHSEGGIVQQLKNKGQIFILLTKLLMKYEQFYIGN